MRELRHRLREYLARVEAGEGFEVTVFGRPVAQLSPLGARQPTMARLVAQGVVTPPVDRDRGELPVPFPVTTGITASAALLDERRGDGR